MGGFLHDIHIVLAGMPGDGIADVLLVAGHILLPVEIVGLHAQGTGRFQAELHHLGSFHARWEAVILKMQPGRALDGQGMHGETFRLELLCVGHRAGKVLHRFTGQACDHIHIDVMDASFPIATITKMGKDGAVVSSDVLVKICSALECTMDDIVEIVPNK